MVMNLQQIQQRHTELVATRNVHRKTLKEVLDNQKEQKDRLEHSEKALIIVQEVAKETQRTLEYRISSLVSTALAAVLPEPPEFVVRFEIRRNQTECDLLIKEGDFEQRPADGSSGGSIDIASFALRIARWSLNKNRPIFIMDEPFRNVSPDLQHKVSDMLRMISEKLGIQILMVSHAENVNVSANKTFLTYKSGDKSTIEEEAALKTIAKIRQSVEGI